MPKTTVSTAEPSNTASRPEFVTCKEAASMVKLSEVSIRRFLTKGKLRRYKVGSRTLIRLSEVLGLIREA